MKECLGLDNVTKARELSIMLKQRYGHERIS